MKRSVTWGRRAALVLAGGMLAAGAATGTALAAPGPTCPTPAAPPNSGSSTVDGGTCSESATITIPSELAIAIDQTSFALPGTAPEPDVYVLSNGANPWYVTLASSVYTNTGNSAFTLPASAVTAVTYASSTTDLGSPVTYVSGPHFTGDITTAPGTPAGWDGFSSPGDFTLTGGMPAAVAGSYTGQVTWTLWSS